MDYKLNPGQEVLQAVELSSQTHILVVKGTYKGKAMISIMKYVIYDNYQGPKSVVAIGADDKEAIQQIIEGLTKAIA